MRKIGSSKPELRSKELDPSIPRPPTSSAFKVQDPRTLSGVPTDRHPVEMRAVQVAPSDAAQEESHRKPLDRGVLFTEREWVRESMLEIPGRLATYL